MILLILGAYKIKLKIKLKINSIHPKNQLLRITMGQNLAQLNKLKIIVYMSCDLGRICSYNYLKPDKESPVMTYPIEI